MQNVNLCAQTPVLDEIRNVAEGWINEIDLFALHSVENGAGGPFGAALYLYNSATKAHEMIGEMMGNAVLSTGCGSAHAEDRTLHSSHIEILKDRLAQLAQQKDQLYIVMVSSAESCPACHSKEQIVARDLMACGLLDEGHFIVVYGATYQDTAEVAGFHDAPYFEDIQKDIGDGLIKVRHLDVADLPADIRQELAQSDQDSCVIVQNGHILSCGHDNLSPYAPFASASYLTIQSACCTQKGQGVNQPWNLRGAVLYTTQSDIGPLTYTECQWANISAIIQIENTGRISSTEARGITNQTLFKIVGTPDYSHPDSAICMMKLDNFANLAQHGWKNRLEQIGNSILYNGIDAA
ncbi:MAG: hypothetical protein PHX61_03050 [Alphaproteobacteria bacterium]|nr:hypothetical protein [Alphaproteobacteria bacterium]